MAGGAGGGGRSGGAVETLAIIGGGFGGTPEGGCASSNGAAVGNAAEDASLGVGALGYLCTALDADFTALGLSREEGAAGGQPSSLSRKKRPGGGPIAL